MAANEQKMKVYLRVFEEESGPFACSERSTELQIQAEGAGG